MSSVVTQPPAAAINRERDLPALALGFVLWIAAGMVTVELLVAARYGIHRDELYFLACARHLAWGYVDQPPLIPTLAWFAMHTLGTSAFALRVFPALAGGGVVVLSACMARELGGARKAQVLAALAAATSPQLLGMFHLLSTAAFDALFWAAVSFVVLRLLRTGDERLWLVVGALAGVGLLNKFNLAFLLGGLAVGLLLDHRARMFRSRWLWGGAAIALLLWLPNVVWNAQHDWAAVEMMHRLHAENSDTGAVLGFIPSQLVVVGPVLIVLWLAGLRRLLRSTFARPFGLTYIVLLVVYALSGAKPYYFAGMYFVLFAAGGVWAEDRLNRRQPPRGLRGWIALMLAGLLIGLPLTLPVLPERALPKSNWEEDINKDLSATVAWRSFVGQVATVVSALPPTERADVVVFVGDYGAAGAIDLWGRKYGLPRAISGHNAYWWWGPGAARDRATTIAVNFSRSYLLTRFSDVERAGTVKTPGNVWSEERDAPIWFCRGQRDTWARMWPALRHYS
jgi:4-amino-4-deoxy-L-arabinose transferase-like glycosyltransferase